VCVIRPRWAIDVMVIITIKNVYKENVMSLILVFVGLFVLLTLKNWFENRNKK